jgi:hypothetical protein
VYDGIVGIWGNVMPWHQIGMVRRFEILGIGIDGHFLGFLFDNQRDDLNH